MVTGIERVEEVDNVTGRLFDGSQNTRIQKIPDMKHTIMITLCLQLLLHEATVSRREGTELFWRKADENLYLSSCIFFWENKMICKCITFRRQKKAWTP